MTEKLRGTLVSKELRGTTYANEPIRRFDTQSALENQFKQVESFDSVWNGMLAQRLVGIAFSPTTLRQTLHGLKLGKFVEPLVAAFFQ